MSRDDKIDFIRGIAVILMIIFHFFSLIDAKKKSSITSHPYFIITGFISRILFIFLLGFNCKNINDKKLKIFNKILLLLFLSLIINLTTLLIYPTNFVRFGILHLLSLSLVFLQILAPFGNIIPLISGIVMFIIFIFVLNKKYSNNIILNSLGVKPNYSTMDYFPIFKWFWIVGLGYYVSQNVKINPQKFDNKFLKLIKNIGKKSLYIYIIHFPIIFTIHKILKIY